MATKETQTNGNVKAAEHDDFVKVENTFADPWKPTTKGESLVATYVGFQDVTTTGPKGQKKEFRSYHLRTNDGERLSVTGAGLTTIMAQIPKKTKIKITFQGTELKGQGEMKVFDVQVPRGTQMLDPFEDESGE